MFKNAIWKNPVGWGKTAGGIGFWSLLFMHIFAFIIMSSAFIFIFNIINKVYIKCLGHPFGIVIYSVVYTLPLLAIGVVFPICYLYALRMISRELEDKNSHLS